MDNLTFEKLDTKEIFWKLILVFVAGLLFFSGLGYERVLILTVGGGLSVLVLVYAFLKNEDLKFPKGFSVYSLFLLFFVISLLWSLDWQRSFAYLMLFVSGGVFWVAFFNLKDEVEKGVEKIILILGILFGSLALAYIFLDFAPFGKAHYNLIFPETAVHHHIGDFWAIVLVFLIYLVFIKKKYLYSLFFILGFYFLAISLTRTAYVSFAVGIIYLTNVLGWEDRRKKIFITFVVLAVVLFLYAGSQKTILFSRPYYTQAVVGFIHNPQGVGVGNFGIISKDPANHILGLSGYSLVAHNIVLEIIVGMGILGISFIYWLLVVSKDILKNHHGKSLPFTAVFLALLINFFFDFTYFIPTMLWLFFIILGMAQSERERDGKEMVILYIMVLFIVMASFLVSLGIITPNPLS